MNKPKLAAVGYLRLPPELRQAIGELARLNRRSLNSELTLAVEEYVRRHKEAKKP